MRDWEFSDIDRDLFARELDSFIPDKIFDAHAHWYRAVDFPVDAVPELVKSGPEVAGHDAYQAAMVDLLPRRQLEGLFFPFPHAGLDVDAANAFLHSELTRHPASRGHMLVTPDMDAEMIRESVRRRGFVGLKCYHVYSSHRPTFESSIPGFLPEAQVRIAHEEGLSITLHMVRSRALADKSNQAEIREYCQRYPDMRLILAHAARGFNPHHTITGIESLRGLDNLWFDTSAVTDSGAIEAILSTFGFRRVLYGSDFPVSQLRGRCVALGDSFLWIDSSNTNLAVPYGTIELALVGHESLRTLKVAARATGLSDSQVEAVFADNAFELWG